MQIQSIDDLFSEEMREAYLSTTQSVPVRVAAVALGLGLLATVLVLVRRRTLREEYTPIWVAVSLVIAVVGVHLELLNAFTRAIGAWDPTSTIFCLGELFLVAICLNYAVRLSRYSIQIKNLGQETALLRERLERLEARGGAEVDARARPS